MILDLHIIPSSGNLKPDYIRDIPLMTSLDGFELHVIPGTADDIRKPHENIFGFIYDKEVLDEKLAEAIPEFMRFANTWDVLVLYKKYITKDGERKYFEAPRIFKPYVQIRDDGALIPKSSDNLRYVYVLDGWLVEDDRKSC